MNELIDAAMALHRATPLIDLHADPLLWTRFVGYDLNKRHRPPLPGALLGGHVDVPRLLEGGVGTQFFGLVTLPFMDFSPVELCHKQIDMLEAACAASQGRLRAPTAQLEHANPSAVQALLGIEGAHNLGGKISNLEKFVQRGVHYLGLLHFSANEAGVPSGGAGTDAQQGLTAWGNELVEACESLRVTVDLAHINKRGFMDVCHRAKRPVMVSHTGVAGAYDLWRNIDDEQIRALANTQGVIGIIFVPAYLGMDGIEGVVRHLEHLINVGGEDIVALGSDWDGFVKPTSGLESPDKMPLLTAHLLERGWPETRIQKLIHRNALRLLEGAS